MRVRNIKPRPSPTRLADEEHSLYAMQVELGLPIVYCDFCDRDVLKLKDECAFCGNKLNN